VAGKRRVARQGRFRRRDLLERLEQALRRIIGSRRVHDHPIRRAALDIRILLKRSGLDRTIGQLVIACSFELIRGLELARGFGLREQRCQLPAWWRDDFYPYASIALVRQIKQQHRRIHVRVLVVERARKRRLAVSVDGVPHFRSEERRVGKEWGERGW